ncbi:RHS domain-containing protein [Pseudomonas sp. BW13M1]|uniref:RHS domain-containing protein n=1 Tax=Pseudomonas peradeniyensis TaxID=2745488 RepID=A0A923G5F8_9PSED|nr:RHS repeat-associated core domain-containing protein [Pseudomonas peradeniyensis]MBV4506465.1 RHS domain-containing protein [Pseudomonas peradeniyensis]
MSDALWAAREGDALLHTSVMADIIGGVLEVAANVAIGALATAAVAAALGITVVTGGLGCFVLGAVVGLVVGVVMAKTGADTGLSRLCEGIGNALFPPTVQATIVSGSPNTKTNGMRAARAAGVVTAPSAPASGGGGDAQAEEQEETFLDMAKGFFSQMWRPTVASPAPNTQEAPDDKVLCTKHPPMPPQYLAEGSSKVLINGHPACRSGDRSTCEAVIVDGGLVSNNVRIGGGPIVVREIRSGKTPGIGLAITALMMLRGRGGKFYSKFGCMLIGGVSNVVTGQVTGALTRAIAGSPNPVHAPTGAKILCSEDDLDFSVQAMLPMDWQRYYNSHDERIDGLFGAGWSVPYEVHVRIESTAGQGERLLLTDEQARVVDMGSITPGEAVFSVGEGLSVRRALNGELLTESREGQYRLFQPTPGQPDILRLSQLGDRNDNRIYLDYDEQGRLLQLRDNFDLVRIRLHYSHEWPQRVSLLEREDADGGLQKLASYGYDSQGDLAQVFDGDGRLVRSFAYDPARRMVEHRTRSGLRCFYEWARHADGWRVSRHWTDAGDNHDFSYDVAAGITQVTDSLGRTSVRQWNSQYQITAFTDALGQTWRFEWNDERQLLAASDPMGAEWQYFYDESGNLAETIDPLGHKESTVWLEHWSLPRSHTDRAGNHWTFAYDKRGNCIRETDPLGQQTRYIHDTRGNPVEITDGAGRSRKLRWNDLGLLVGQTDCSGYTTRFSYDTSGHLHTLVDALGERTEYQHDALGRLVGIVLSDGRREECLLDSNGLLTRHIDSAGHVTQYHRNSRGQLERHIDPLGREVTYHYDRHGRLLTLRNENGETSGYVWDEGDRLILEQNVDGSARKYQYDGQDNLTHVTFIPTPGSNDTPIVHHMTYDLGGRLVARCTDSGRTDYRHDPLDQLLTIRFTDDQGFSEQLDFTYDALGQLREERGPNGTLQHLYDPLGNVERTRLADGRWINRLYYGSGHLHQLNLDGRVVCDFQRDRLHRETLRTQGRLSTRNLYDRSGRLRTRLRHTSALPENLPAEAQQRFEMDDADNLSARQVQRPGSQYLQTLQHDRTGRILARQDSPTGQREMFTYDAAANVLDPSQAGAGLVRHNRLITYEDKRYRYDGFGRLVEKRSRRRGTQLFEYNADHRLVRIRNLQPGREQIVEMRYDPLGRRTEKRVSTTDGHVLCSTRFSWDGLRLLTEQRNGLHTLYLYGDDEHDPLARVDGQGASQQLRYYHNDLIGMPDELTDEQGQSLWVARHLTWGGTWQEQRVDSLLEEQNLRYQGQYLDRETGLHYNLFRFYDPDVGRFTQPDPIGMAGGFNLYQYAPTPFTWFDPWGLLKEGETAGYGAKAHRGDGLEAHELMRNKYLQDIGLAPKRRRMRGNPSIALSPKNHDAVHLEENRLRRQLGLKPNQMLKSGRAEIRLMSQAIYNSLVVKGKITQQQLRTARRSAIKFAKGKGCY